MSEKVSKKVERNVPGWFPSDSDYQLIFCLVDGIWRECGHTIRKFSNMILSDYLHSVDIFIPDYTQFLRIIRDDMHFEYRSNGNRVRIDVTLF